MRGNTPLSQIFSNLRLLNRSWVNGEPISTVLAIFRASGTTRSTACIACALHTVNRSKPHTG